MGWPTRLVLNFDTISTKPEKSLSGKLSEILGTSKMAKKDEKLPQLDGMIELKEEKSHRKKESEAGNSRQKESKTKENEPTGSKKKDSSKIYIVGFLIHSRQFT